MNARTAEKTARSGWPTVISQALQLPSGARFYKCALQVNPFAYLARHAKTTSFADEQAYNTAMVDACIANGIEVIGVTDHYRITTSVSLIQAARAAGLHVFPGFEACSKDGVHILCLFDPDRDIATIERIIGDCGIHDDKIASPTGKHDATELLDACRTWGGVCVAAHVTSTSGLLTQLHGQARVNAWKHKELLACSIPGTVSGTPDDKRPIIENKNAEYRRERPIAVLNSHDVDGPAHFSDNSCSCWIKMSTVSVGALRQAFLDPDSRIRLASDPKPEEHTELLAIAWQGGFLDEAGIHFNENLNALIGGRGTGKSTVIESIRYAIDGSPLGEDAQRLHDDFVKHVLRSGTKVSLLVRSHRPAKREYLIERTVPSPPIVKDAGGAVTKLSPADIVPQAEVYGQHEISELTRHADKLTLLLERFVERDATLQQRKKDIARQLEETREASVRIAREMQQLEQRLETLPGLEETLKRYEETGLREKLKDRSSLVKEEASLNPDYSPTSWIFVQTESVPLRKKGVKTRTTHGTGAAPHG
jgi:histidinol phosphatase-like PHP family hydrolase